MRKVVMAEPYVPKEAIGGVVETLNSRWIGQAHKVDRFEEIFKKKFKQKSAVAVNSGTAALELAYDLIGLKPGDEVITTPLTCTATNIPLVRRGVKLVFADISKKTLNIDVEDVKRKITKKTKAIVHVSLGGIPSKIPSFDGIKIVHDAAQALGVFNENDDYTMCSFQAIKHVTTGDGGMLVCKDMEDDKKARLWRWFGIDREVKIANNWEPYKQRKILFDIEYPGYKFQMNDIAAALGIAGLGKYTSIINKRKRIFEVYKKAGLPLVDAPGNTYWLATLLVNDRDGFSQHMRQGGVETNVMQVRNDLYKIFKPFKSDLPNMDWVEGRYICIPIHNKMNMEDARYVAKLANSFLCK